MKWNEEGGDCIIAIQYLKIWKARGALKYFKKVLATTYHQHTKFPHPHTTITQQNNCKNNPCTRTPPGANPHPSRCQSRSAPRSCNLIAITTVDLPPPCVAHLWKALKSTGWKVDNVLIMYTRVYTTHYQPGRGTTCPCPHLSLLLRHCTDRLGGVARRICPSSYFLYF